MKSNGNLFETLVVVENYPLDYNMDANKTLKIDKYSMVENTNYNITLGIMTFKNLELHFNYNNSVISEELVLKLGGYFQEILESIVKDKNRRVKEIEILTSEEKKRLIYEFNNTDADYPRDSTLKELFEEQVEKTPYNTAVVFEDRRLSFKELNEKANRLARTLREKGVKPDSIVGIMLEPSLEMIVGMFAVLKAGGAYLPIDPEYPEDRIMHIINDSNTNILLTQSKLIDRLSLME
jgi:non-ribosomal peptide synthetase component F